MDDLTKLFPDVADALGIDSVAIVEKDYYIVELLRLLQPLAFDTHQLSKTDADNTCSIHCQSSGQLLIDHDSAAMRVCVEFHGLLT